MPKCMVLSPSAKKRLISSLTYSRADNDTEEKGFALKCSAEFASRSTSVFGQLQDIEKCHQTWVTENKTEESFAETNVPSEDQAKTDDFKKPFEPLALKRRKIMHPRLRRNPNKWIKYSLADIPVSSDATNSAVAFKFLDELRKRRENKCENMNLDSENVDKVTFCKPINCFKNSKQKTKLSVETVSSCTADISIKEDAILKEISSSVVKLEHLQDEYDA